MVANAAFAATTGLSIASAAVFTRIAVPEMLYMANQIWSDSVNVPEMMTFLLIAYVFLVGVLVWGMHRWERAMRLPGFGA